VAFCRQIYPHVDALAWFARPTIYFNKKSSFLHYYKNCGCACCWQLEVPSGWLCGTTLVHPQRPSASEKSPELRPFWTSPYVLLLPHTCRSFPFVLSLPHPHVYRSFECVGQDTKLLPALKARGMCDQRQAPRIILTLLTRMTLINLITRITRITRITLGPVFIAACSNILQKYGLHLAAAYKLPCQSGGPAGPGTNASENYPNNLANLITLQT
jgi:hypothetical protein